MSQTSKRGILAAGILCGLALVAFAGVYVSRPSTPSRGPLGDFLEDNQRRVHEADRTGDTRYKKPKFN